MAEPEVVVIIESGSIAIAEVEKHSSLLLDDNGKAVRRSCTLQRAVLA